MFIDHHFLAASRRQWPLCRTRYFRLSTTVHMQVQATRLARMHFALGHVLWQPRTIFSPLFLTDGCVGCRLWQLLVTPTGCLRSSYAQMQKLSSSCRKATVTYCRKSRRLDFLVSVNQNFLLCRERSRTWILWKLGNPRFLWVTLHLYILQHHHRLIIISTNISLILSFNTRKFI